MTKVTFLQWMAFDNWQQGHHCVKTLKTLSSCHSSVTGWLVNFCGEKQWIVCGRQITDIYARTESKIWDKYAITAKHSTLDYSTYNQGDCYFNNSSVSRQKLTTCVKSIKGNGYILNLWPHTYLFLHHSLQVFLNSKTTAQVNWEK